MANQVLWFVLGGVVGALVSAVVLLARHGRTAAETARLRAELDAARRSADEQKVALDQAHERLRDTFAALSKDALKENRAEFLETADGWLKPVRETLDRVQAQLVDVDRNREGTRRALEAQIGSLQQAHEHLRSAAEGLSQSLRSPNVRGKWGEIQLRRIVELAGLLPHCDFDEKPSATGDDGSRQTPDLVVRLPGGASVVIDSKVPIDAYLAAVQAEDEAERQIQLAAHARQVRDHIRALAAKEYAKQFQPSPEFVVMFLPLESLLPAAFEQDGTLLERAASLNVIPATPMTLLALLKAVAYGWQQQRLATNAEEIQQLGRELYERLATMVGHLASVGSSLKQAADGYDRFIGSLEQKVLPGARRFKELGVSSSKELEVPEHLRLSVRRVQREELTGGSESDAGPLFKQRAK